MKTAKEFTLDEFRALPFSEDAGEFDSLVILPTEELHDSGYRCMDFVACFKGVPTYRLSGGSDVIHLDGIGGYGYKWLEKYAGVPKTVPAIGWNVDCLPTSGLLQIFTHRKLIAGTPYSSFEIYAIPPSDEQKDKQ